LIRHFLLLQGPIGPFFARLGGALRQAGHRVTRVHFNGGDRVYSGLMKAINFRGTTERWVEFFDRILVRHGITDLVLFGDCRPLHRLAIDHAHGLGLRIHVFEEGYLRPGWVTLETNGVNGYSSLSRSAATYLADPISHTNLLPAASCAPMPFARRAFDDVVYTFATALLKPWYPGYRTHKPWSPLQEYRAGARRFFLRAGHRRHATAITTSLTAQQRPFFLFPLQLDSDAQIRVHSGLGSMTPAIDAVVRSFASHAAKDAVLVVSEHPLDQAVVDLHEEFLRAVSAAGIYSRVIYLRGGTPLPLIQASQGMVTVNSTIALSALEFGRPVAALGCAIYRIPGLTHVGTLDEFWRAPSRPDAILFAAFKRRLIETTQVPGGFYSPAAQRSIIETALPRLLGPELSPTAAARPGSERRSLTSEEAGYATATE